ncbi:transporter substrate-binding domain-containing protein [Gallaecimonas mangrovi]|uniref:transporter substrate-binding domain-containing protein n=1 Tax=Gallaecimonas mangrovi TaxID=2291597 RepID=UPI00186661FF|nr:transporter substrate-binding domain-containing protein [Gallaecimonas mangrovi]
MAWAQTTPVAGKPLVFGTEATYPPFEYRNDAGQLVGVDIDVAHRLCDLLKRPCIIVEHPFDNLMDELDDGDLDAVIAALDISSHYSSNIRFSDPYYRNSAVYVTLKDATDRYAKSGYIGVQNGSNHQQYLIDQRQWQLTSYDDLNGALTELRQGRISAIFVDSAVANAWFSDPANKDLRIVGSPIRDFRYFGRGMGIALSRAKSKDSLLDNIDKALSEMRDDGSLNRILSRYLRVH